ncbi:MAG TPA: hypothetical protein VLJ19_05990 [Variovorax sp.]|nr:hypothetical protein [Variovorax sp.]
MKRFASTVWLAAEAGAACERQGTGKQGGAAGEAERVQDHGFRLH